MRPAGHLVLVLIAVTAIACSNKRESLAQADDVGGAGTGGGGTGNETGGGGTGGNETSGGGTGGSETGGGGTGGSETGGGGTGGNCVWKSDGFRDPTPSPLSCNISPFYNARTDATVAGDQLTVSLIPCGCGGNYLCFDHGRPTAVHVEVEGDWATVVDEGFADSCGIFNARLKPNSATAEGQIRVTGSYSGVDMCHQPLTCPGEARYQVLRGTAGGVLVTTPNQQLNRCSIDGGAGGTCAGANLGCPRTISESCQYRSSGDCASSWSAALAEICARGAGDNRTFTCAGYNVRTFTLSGRLLLSYYDATTGKLVATLGSDEFSTGCSGGPTDFRVPSCPNPTVQLPSCP